MNSDNLKYNLLYIDDEKHNLSTFKIAFRHLYNIYLANNAFEALDIIDEQDIHLIISDQRMEGMSGVEFFKRIKKSHPHIIRVILTGYSDMKVIISAINDCGIFRFLMKPWEKEEISQTIKNGLEIYDLRKENRLLLQKLKQANALLKEENKYLMMEVSNQGKFGEILTVNESYKKLLSQIQSVAATNSTVIIQGESGTGKELIARALYNLSKLTDKPLIKVNCAALPVNLVESELFGHEKGAFTGASERRIGRFELADKGTIFLDEVGELNLEVQSKILRVLQEGEFQRLGGNETKKVKVRVLAATNRNLEKMVKEGKFRNDLYYRLNVFPIETIPLRQRPEDIEILTNHFISVYNQPLGRKVAKVSDSNMSKLKGYTWPGNIRELENIIQRYMITSKEEELELNDWSPKAHDFDTSSASKIVSLEENEKNYIIKILELTRGKVFGNDGAAEILEINPKTLSSKMKKLGINRL